MKPTEILTIDNVMHPFPHTVGLDATLVTAMAMMQEYGVRHLPVKEANTLVGILSERDIDFVLRAEKREAKDVRVRDAYSSDPYMVPSGTPVATVAMRMAHERLGCTLVLKNTELIGIFTTVDACRTLAETLSGKLEQ